MEACATAHYWARELTKLGHRLRLMPAKDVKAYVKRNKNDAADAEEWTKVGLIKNQTREDGAADDARSVPSMGRAAHRRVEPRA
jgi:transposase